MPKHVHADLIKAWADGAEIELFDEIRDVWIRVATPAWDTWLEYRIKPKTPVVLAGIEVPKPDPKGSWSVRFNTFAQEFMVAGYGPDPDLFAYQGYGMAHSTRDNAQAHADALNAFHKQLLES